MKKKMTFEKKAYYFLASAIPATAKTMWYAFTLPSSVRKVIEKDNNYKRHKEVLTRIAQEKNEIKDVKRSIDIGDLVGFFGAVAGMGLYGSMASQHPNMFKAWLITNGLSLGYEITRVIDKEIRRE